MVRLGAINRHLRRRPRLTATAGALIVAGVVALNAHAALPEHHEHHGEETVCIASLSIAVAVAGAWLGSRKPAALWSTFRARPVVVRLPDRPLFAPAQPPAAARAGPLCGSTVLRR